MLLTLDVPPPNTAKLAKLIKTFAEIYGVGQDIPAGTFIEQYVAPMVAQGFNAPTPEVFGGQEIVEKLKALQGGGSHAREILAEIRRTYLRLGQTVAITDYNQLERRSPQFVTRPMGVVDRDLTQRDKWVVACIRHKLGLLDHDLSPEQVVEVVWALLGTNLHDRTLVSSVADPTWEFWRSLTQDTEPAKAIREVMRLYSGFEVILDKTTVIRLRTRVSDAS